MPYVKIEVSERLLNTLKKVDIWAVKKMFFGTLLKKIEEGADDKELERRVRSILIGDVEICFSQIQQQEEKKEDKPKFKLPFSELKEVGKEFAKTSKKE